MILCDPFAINTLSLSTVRHLQELVGQETLPRVSVLDWPQAAFRWVPGCTTPPLSTCTPHSAGAWGPGSEVVVPGPC